MKHRSTILMPLLFLSACATSAFSDVGLTVPAAAERGGYGAPFAVEDLPDGKRAFHWEMRHSIVVRTTQPAGAEVYGPPHQGSPLRASEPKRECVYTLVGAWDDAARQWKVTGFRKPHISCIGS